MKRLHPLAVFFAVATASLGAQAPARAPAPRLTISAPAPSTTARVLPTPALRAALLPGTRTNIQSTIQGNALTSTNGALTNAPVRLRDARGGRIVDTQVTDRSGLFAFGTIDPGMYIVEVVGPDKTILAASQLLTVDAGQAVSTVVKLPWRNPPLGGLLGHSVPSAAAVASAAAASGVLAETVVGAPASS